jgi:hypothetical protein
MTEALAGAAEKEKAGGKLKLQVAYGNAMFSTRAMAPAKLRWLSSARAKSQQASGMGLSDIAKAPLSHGVEPHDLETSSSLRSRRQPFRTSCRPSPRLPRERFRCVPGMFGSLEVKVLYPT